MLFRSQLYCIKSQLESIPIFLQVGAQIHLSRFARVLHHANIINCSAIEYVVDSELRDYGQNNYKAISDGNNND